MKKFKTRNIRTKIKYCILLFLLLIMFVIISFFKLNNSNEKLISYLTYNFDKKDVLSRNILTLNLDHFVNTYLFHEPIIVYKKKYKKVYLYNTHNLEKYKDGTTIYEATKLLKNNLAKLGISAVLEEKKTNELLHTGLSYYEISRTFIKDIMNKDHEFDYYLDIHCDTANDTTITINNKKYAKIMFVLGLDNNNYENNKQIMEKMNDYLNHNYPGISKGIYEKTGTRVDGVYNQDLNDNVLLIEMGGINNNREEVNNSTEIISLMIYHMIGD